jgi:cell division septation protein DedD
LKNVNLLRKRSGDLEPPYPEKVKKRKTGLYVVLLLFILGFLGIAGTWGYINFFLPLKESDLINLLESEKKQQTTVKTPAEDKTASQTTEPAKDHDKEATAKPEESGMKSETEKNKYLIVLPEGKKHPYVVHAASFQKFDNALRFVDPLLNKEIPVYIGLYSIPKKGNYYRVMIGRFETYQDSANYIETLQKDGLIKSAYSVKTPFSLELSTHDSYKEALDKASDLRKKGYAPVIFPFQSKSEKKEIKYKVLLGAYKTKDEANKSAGVLLKRGLKTSVIAP